MQDQGTYPRLLALALTSHAVLAQELVLTRLFSATIWYYFAFLTVSLALIGLGAGAIWVHLRADSVEEGGETLQAGWSALAGAIASVFALGAYLQLYPHIGTTSLGGVLAIAAIVIIYCVPAFCSGVTVAWLIYAMSSRPGIAYAADLLGAALGTGSAVLLLESVSPQSALIWISVSLGLAGLVLLWRRASARRVALATGGLVLALALGALLLPRLDSWQLGFARGHQLPPILMDAWNSMSRITVHRETRGHWGQPKLGEQAWPEQLDFKIDGGAQTAVTRFTGDLSRVRFLADNLESLPFRLLGRPPKRTLVLGSGGGNGVLVARLMGSKAVQAVEINPLIPELLLGPLRDFAAPVYEAPGISLAVEDARTFVRRDPTSYDVVTLTYVDTFASSAGAYALSENYLYTVEAFSDYMQRLAPEGVFGFLRTRSAIPADTLKAVLLAREALLQRGVTKPGLHFVILGAWASVSRGVTQVAVKLRPFTQVELARARGFAKERSFDILYLPGGEKNHPVYQSFLDEADPSPLVDAYPVSIAPTTDDSPFFFFNLGESDQQDLSIWIIPATAIILILVGLLFLWGVPRQLGVRVELPPHYLALFACLGLAFMLIEFVLMQRFILLLGQPIYALGATLAGILLGLGAGSLLSKRLVGDARKLFLSLLVAAGAVVVAGVGQPYLIDAVIYASIQARVLAALALVVPLGLVLGLQLPSAIRVMDQQGHRRGIPWAWAANSFASVLSTVAAVGLGILLGFHATVWVAAALYLLAALFAARISAEI